MSECCKHYRAMADHKTCEVGIVYETVRARPGKYKFPCHSDEFKTCPHAVYQTPEEKKAELDEIGKMAQQFFESLGNDICPYCGEPIKHKEQVGRCVYAYPCGCRLYRGKL